MTNYGLKINSKYDTNDYPEKIMTTAGDVVLFQSGIYKIYCDGDTFIKHNVCAGLMHVTCISVRDNIKINILANGILENTNAGSEAAGKYENKIEVEKIESDTYHKIISQNKNVEMNIKTKAVVDGSSKIIYRSSIGGMQNSTGTGSQDAKFIMLSDESEIDAEPRLDLNTNNIPTSHNVSIGGFENKDMFYVNLHGLTEKESEEFLVEAFLNY